MSMATSEYEDAPTGQLQLIAWFAAALVAAVLVGGVWQHIEASYYGSLNQNENRAKTELLRAAMLEDIITEDQGRLETMVELYQESNPNFLAIEVADDEGKALVTWDRESDLVPQSVMMFFSRIYPREETVVPVNFEGENYGMIRAMWDVSEAGARRDTHIYATAGVVGFLCFAFAFVGYRVGRRHR